MKTVKIIALLALMAPMAGCEQNKMMDSNVPAALYIDWQSWTDGQKEKFNMTFAFQADTTWNFVFPLTVRATGPMADYDRPIGLLQVLDGDHDAIALPNDMDITDTKAWLYGQAVKRGEVLDTPEKVDAATAAGITAHYVGFDHPRLMEFIMKYTWNFSATVLKSGYLNSAVVANHNGSLFPIMILKDPSMNLFTSTKPLVEPGRDLDIHVQIKENDHFAKGIHDNVVSGRNTDFRLYFTNEMAPPLKWATYWSRHFKSWGPVKFKFLRDATGFTDWEMTKTPDLSFDQLSYMRNQARELIRIYNEAHPNDLLREPVVEGQSYSGKLVDIMAVY